MLHMRARAYRGAHMEKKNQTRRRRTHAAFAPILFALLACTAANVRSRDLRSVEADETGVAITLDDDLFSGPGRDRDYTGGFALTVSGARAARNWFSLDPLLAKIDRGALAVSADAWEWANVGHALSLGAIAFTPHDVAALEPVRDDRPYASLVFLSSARRYVSERRAVVYNTTLTFGALGLSAAGSGHRAIHRLTGSDPLRGYAHQISAGGEPTLRYGVARQALLSGFTDRADLKWTLAASAGTITEGSVAISGRWGRIRSPWWSFTPEQSMYMQDPQPLTTPAGPEMFFVAGVRVKARAYNAFLQGQFRHSDLRYTGAELNAILAEGWGGLVMRKASGLQIHYLAHWGSPELRHGPNARTIMWGSLEFVRPFGRGR